MHIYIYIYMFYNSGLIPEAVALITEVPKTAASISGSAACFVFTYQYTYVYTYICRHTCMHIYIS